MEWCGRNYLSAVTQQIPSRFGLQNAVDPYYITYTYCLTPVQSIPEHFFCLVYFVFACNKEAASRGFTISTRAHAERNSLAFRAKAGVEFIYCLPPVFGVRKLMKYAALKKTCRQRIVSMPSEEKLAQTKRGAEQERARLLVVEGDAYCEDSCVRVYTENIFTCWMAELHECYWLQTSWKTYDRNYCTIGTAGKREGENNEDFYCTKSL